MAKKDTSPVGQLASEVRQEHAKKSKRYRDEMKRREPYQKIARAIIFRRAELEMTQKELAELIGTKDSAISRIESGQHPSNLKTLQRLAEALDLELTVDLEKRQPKAKKPQKIAA